MNLLKSRNLLKLTFNTCTYTQKKLISPLFNKNVKNIIYSNNNNSISRNLIFKENQKNNRYRFYSSSNHHEHNQRKHEQQQQQQNNDEYFNEKEFSKPPFFYKTISAIVIGSVIYHFIICETYFSSDRILSDIQTILTTDDQILKNNLIKAINKRAQYPFTIEKLFKLGVVEVLVNALDDPDPTTQATIIKTLSTFVDYRYETFAEEAVKKGVGTKLGRIILDRGMNCSSATNLWCSLFFSPTNQMQLLTSNDLISTLKDFAYSDVSDLQELAMSTIKLLYTNRDAYPLLPKIKGILNHLKKSHNILVSNNSEYYLGVLKDEFLPPVGNVTINHVDSPLMYKVHTFANVLMVPLTFIYCSYRWKKYTTDLVYSKAKGVYGAGTVLLAGILASISFYPHYYSYKIDKRLKKEFHVTEKSSQEIKSTKVPGGSSLLKLNNDVSKNNNSSSSFLNIGNNNNNNDPNNSKEKKPNWVFAPLPLFFIHQLFPILGSIILLNGWKKSRYIAIPSLFLVIPISTLSFPTLTNNWKNSILNTSN